jgi:hypothetical protein
MSMFIVTRTGELWSFGDFCRSEHVKPVSTIAYGTNRDISDRQVQKEADQSVAMADAGINLSYDLLPNGSSAYCR